MEDKRWEVFTNRVHLSLNNVDGIFWKFEVCMWLSDERTTIRGMPIGFLTSEGFISNPKDEEFIYRMEWNADGRVAFFRKPKK